MPSGFYVSPGQVRLSGSRGQMMDRFETLDETLNTLVSKAYAVYTLSAARSRQFCNRCSAYSWMTLLRRKSLHFIQLTLVPCARVANCVPRSSKSQNLFGSMEGTSETQKDPQIERDTFLPLPGPLETRSPLPDREVKGSSPTKQIWKNQKRNENVMNIELMMNQWII